MSRNENTLAVAHGAIKQFREEKKQFDKIIDAQIGATVPEFFSELKTAVINPSAIGVGILDRMIETDDTISSALEFKILMILARIGDYHHKDQGIREFVQNFIKKMKGPTWEQALEGICSACGFGFSVTEILWAINEHYEIYPRSLKTYHPSTICFEMDKEGIADDGILQFTSQFSQTANPNRIYPAVRYGWKQQVTFETPPDRLTPIRIPYINNFGVVRIPRNKVVHHAYRAGRAFGSPYGKTPVRTAHLAWQLKNFFIKQLGIAGDKASMPTTVGRAPQNGQNVRYKGADGVVQEMTPREAMIEMLRDIKSKDSIVIGPEAEGYFIDVLQNTVQLSSFTDVINNLNVYIFRCFLIPSLVMTDGSAGSRALGDKHFEIVGHIADVDARNFTQTIINDLIQPAIEKNFGPQDSYGEFQKRHQSTEEVEKLSNIFLNLVNMGALDTSDQEDFAHVRKSVGLPEKNNPIVDTRIEVEEELEVDPDPEITVEDADLQDTAFNGAQITALVDVIKQVAQGEIPRESGIETIVKGFNVSREQAEKLMGEAGKSFVPKSAKEAE